MEDTARAVLASREQGWLEHSSLICLEPPINRQVSVNMVGAKMAREGGKMYGLAQCTLPPNT